MKYILFLAYFLCMISNIFAGGARKPTQKFTRQQLAKRAAALRARRPRGLPAVRRRQVLPQRQTEGALPQARRLLFEEIETKVPKKRPIQPRRIPKAEQRKRVFAEQRIAKEELYRAEKKEVSRPEEEAELKRKREERKQFLEKRFKARRAVIEPPEYEEEVFIDEEEEIPPPLPPREEEQEERPLPEIPESESLPKKSTRETIEEETERLFRNLEDFEKQVKLNPYDIQLKFLLERYGRTIKQFLEKPNSELTSLKMPGEWANNLHTVQGMIKAFNIVAQLATKPDQIEIVKRQWLYFLQQQSNRLNVDLGF